jgi:hypothetical protein
VAGEHHTVVLSDEQVDALFGGLRPSTPDDVSITSDGQRLNTKEKVLAELEEIRTGRRPA